MTSDGTSTAIAGTSDDFPSSVEEAGALLGMAITRLSVNSSATHKAPPSGMHSSFTVRTEVPSTELFMRLYQLRVLLRKPTENNEPLVAAPSILAVLMKLLTLSSSMAPSYLHYNEALSNSQRPETPPMLSEALRHLWVDAVALCHVHGERLTGSAKIQTTQFLRQMLALASTNPRSQKAAGGVRVAALQVVRALFTQMPSRMAPWSLDVLQVCQKALRSAGNGEPSYRVAAMEAAVATATACREAHLQKTEEPSLPLVLAGAFEEKALVEITRILKQAALDKFPEVRRTAAVLCAVAAPLSLTSSPNPTEALAALDEWMPLCVKNLDDASAFVSQSWAQALARGLCTVLEYQGSRDMNSSGAEDADIGETRASPSTGTTPAARKSWLSQMRSTRVILRYMAQQFVRAGGELGAARMGGPFSTGGRGVRLGWTLAIVEFLRHIGTVKGIEINQKEWRKQLLKELLGSELEKQLKQPDNQGNANPLFASAAQRNWSKADAPLVRTLVSRVFRQGLTEGSAEPIQIGLLDDWVLSLDTHHQSKPPTDEGNAKGSEMDDERRLNANQLQVALVEISHLIATLGEAMSSKVDEILLAVQKLLEHSDTGVRFEAAVACAALVNHFPDVGLNVFSKMISEIQVHHAELMRLATSGDSQSDEPQPKQGGLRMFRKKEKQVDSSAPHQHSIHGKAILISLLLRDMPQSGNGLLKDLVSSVIPVTEVLVSCQFNETLTQAFPAAACVCVRAGYSIISGIMTTGPGGVAPHIPMIFEAWNRSQKTSRTGGKYLAARHDLFCIDSLLVSVVAFLKHCSELLLSIPEALTQVSVVLEELLPLLTGTGRLANLPLTPPVAAKLESTRASLLEAFAWLPSGSFPMAADDVFALAAEQIKAAVDAEVSCSILQELVNEEDSLLDVKTVGRASKEAHSGGARDLAMSLIALESEAVHPAEQESVMHLISRPRFSRLGEGFPFQESHILGVFAKRTETEKPPTPLHEVGAWRRPIDPCCSSKVRLIDAAIQAFSATFGLKSGKEQQSAMDMLESLVPPYYAQLARAIGVNAALTEQERRTKNKEDSAAMTNITAVLLSCLQSLPLHESTHNVPISLGPPWMNKAKDLLLTLLPSGSNDIRRAAAEGLALLATLGVSEDAHFLQSKVLHSLDEVMQGNRPDAKVLRALPVESVAAARAGSLLTLACIQRTASHILERQLERARIRSGSSVTVDATNKNNSVLPIFQMITRILPSINYFGFRDYLVVRSYAIHAFAVLLAYSERLEGEELGPVERQLLEKAIELVEDNFCSSWMAASNDVDRGEEPEKMAAETSLLSVLLRLMVFLAKHLHKVDTSYGGHSRRFALIGCIILEKHRLHPYVVREVMALFEVLAPTLSANVPQTKAYSQEEMIKHTFTCATPGTSAASQYASAPWDEMSLLSFGSARACLFAELSLSLFRHAELPMNCSPSILAARCLSLLERASASQYFDGARVFRWLAASARSERRFFESSVIREETPKFLLSLVASDASHDALCLRWILFARAVISGPRASQVDDTAEELQYSIEKVTKHAFDVAENDAVDVVKSGNPSRTDVKAVASQMLALSLWQLFQNQGDSDGGLMNSHQFNYFEAKRVCLEQLKERWNKNAPLPESRLVFHLQELVTTICMASNAALDHSELCSIQESSIYILAKIIEAFSRMEDPEVPDTKLLEQYAQQIFSSIKHALSAADENSSESAVRVFHAGCIAVCSVVDYELSTDVAVIKRLVRPIVASLNEAPLVRILDGKQLFEEGKVLLAEAKTVCEVWATGQLFFKDDETLAKDYIKQAKKDLLTSTKGLATYFGLVAMEGARLLAASNLTLVGKESKGERKPSSLVGPGGIFAANDADLSDIAKSLIVRSWSACCRSAIHCLTELSGVDLKDDESSTAEAWLEAMASLAIEGVEDGLKSLESDGSSVYGLDSVEIVVECLNGVLLLVQRKPELLSRRSSRIDRMLNSLRRSIIDAVLEGTSKRNDIHAVDAACKLLRAMADADTKVSQTALITTFLTPLKHLESGKFDLASKSCAILLGTSLSGMATVIARLDVQASFVQSILALVLEQIFNTNHDFPEAIAKAAKKVVVECIGHKTTSRKKRGELAKELVAANEWDAWAVAFMADGGVATSESLERACLVLTDEKSPYQLHALSAIQTIVQSFQPPNDVVGRVMEIAGSSVIEIFYSYGTGKFMNNSRSQVACAGAMKIILISFMQLAASGLSEEEFGAFLGVIFGVFLGVIRFNGFPNHPSPQSGGDPALGRLCAQAILHVAKTAPSPFKTCVGALAPHDRALLEFAVRGEMTGYQVQESTQQKKKLNLKNFKK